MTVRTVALSSGYWDAGYLNALGRGAGAIVLYSIVGLVLMLIGFYAIDLTTPGPLRKMVDAGKPNAIIVSAAGMVSMALIVVLAIYASSGKLLEGLVGSAVFGLVGIAAQVVMMRIATLVVGIDMEGLFQSDEYRYESLMVAASQFALGIVVAVAIL
ncbi:hypothetical protein MSAS_32600 [Mycobacterium saskatchewanense]|uniref:DUF350 domain-containing protein n=1 Tax=Mycobacterium saskatchewanense TaxID=220927 RepID=A0AAJ3TT12_9MYCO|nr:DUF350 domain-containing protein [Mycobacterium saskatchewanense]ORW64643.1 hypothetical protein AWC23_25405 [Mycobacterium saskatchewanense]BBX64086.1 hypothetical protein MSAS_32600 [Mycobacterium saskatchewanense]